MCRSCVRGLDDASRPQRRSHRRAARRPAQHGVVAFGAGFHVCGERGPRRPIGQGGFYFGFTANQTNYGFSLTPTRVTILLSSGHFVFPGTYDNTQFHDYLFEFTPPTITRIYRDGVLLGTSTAGFPAALSNRATLGDGTGGANGQGEVTAFRFIQDVGTVTTPTSWGRVKALFR